MNLDHDTALRIVDTWRQLSDGNRTARTYVTLVEAVPRDDPDELVAVVGALTRGLAAQIAELARLVEATGGTIAEGLELDPDPPHGPESSARAYLDELIGWETPDADR